MGGSALTLKEQEKMDEIKRMMEDGEDIESADYVLYEKLEARKAEAEAGVMENPLFGSDDEVAEDEGHQQSDYQQQLKPTQNTEEGMAQMVDELGFTPPPKTPTEETEVKKPKKNKARKYLKKQHGHSNVGRAVEQEAIDEKAKEMRYEAEKLGKDPDEAVQDFLDQHKRVTANKTIFDRSLLKRTFGVAGIKGRSPYMKYRGRKTDENVSKFTMILGAASALSGIVGGVMALSGGKWEVVKIPVAISIAAALATIPAEGVPRAYKTHTKDKKLKEELDLAIQSNNSEKIDKILLEINEVYPDIVARSVDKTLVDNADLQESLDEAGLNLTQATDGMEPSKAAEVNDAAADAVEQQEG